MTVFEMFSDPSSEISEDNFSNLSRFVSQTVKTTENLRISVNNIEKRFQVYYKGAKQKHNIASDGSD